MSNQHIDEARFLFMQECLEELKLSQTNSSASAAAKDLQLSLIAALGIILDRIKDDIPLGCRKKLITDVRSSINKYFVLVNNE